MMDISIFHIEELLLAAVKSEIESREVYNKLADQVQNAFLKDKLRFLAGEEEKHRAVVTSIFKKKFPHKGLSLPEKSPVPLPQIKTEGLVSEVFESAMQAEMSAHDFYNALSEKFADDQELKRTMVYLAVMELGHYRALELEKETMDRYEDYDTTWPNIHLGP
jgi:rubrerythrin